MDITKLSERNGELPPLPTVAIAAAVPPGEESDRGQDCDTSLCIEWTGYRLLSISLITAFGIAKATASGQGKTSVSNILDSVFGVPITLG